MKEVDLGSDPTKAIAWITGGGTGIGRALAEELYRQGARVIISGRRADVIEQTVKTIRNGPGGEIIGQAGDASDSSHTRDIACLAEKIWGPITLLINNAGTYIRAATLASDASHYLTSFRINCLSAVTATQAVLPAMLKANAGTIINISSVCGKWAFAWSGAYSVSKHALTGYTDALRQALRDSAIHVMGVYPGFIRTDINMPYIEPHSFKLHFAKTPEQMAGAILKAMRRRKIELYYPRYVPWILRIRRWFPRLSDQLGQQIRL